MTSGLRLLVVEPLASAAALSRAMLEADGHTVHTATTLDAARARLAARDLDALLLDPAMAGLPDLRLVSEFADRAGAPVIVVSGNGSIAQAVAAMRAGAADYLVKPVARDRLKAALSIATTAARATARLAEAEADPSPDNATFYRFVGASAPMQEVYRRLRAVAASSAPVFITGESGTGKELAASAVHDLGRRAGGPFVAINCGAIPRDLMESEIFGHVRGAFTGAVADRLGAARAAHGGTLFLDEICELDAALQTKLLRFIEMGIVHPVGSTTPERVDVRLVCATNRTPSAEVKAGRFREDLYFRLHVLPVHLPPLRMRGDDVLVIARACLARMAAEEGKRFAGFSAEAEAALLAHSWPGNVRELQNAVREAVVMNEGETLEASMLPIAPGLPSPSPIDLDAFADSAAQSLRQLKAAMAGGLKDIQRSAIEQAIAQCGGSIPRAARLLGVAPSTVYRRREMWEQTGRPC